MFFDGIKINYRNANPGFQEGLQRRTSLIKGECDVALFTKEGRPRPIKSKST